MFDQMKSFHSLAYYEFPLVQISVNLKYYKRNTEK